MATVLATESGDIQGIEVTDNNVVYQLGSGGQRIEIKSVPKTGDTPVSLVTATGTDDVYILFAKNNRVYYNILNRMIAGTSVTIVPVAAGVIDDNGMNQAETMTAVWSGVIYGTTLDLNTVTLGNLIEKVILVEGYDIAGT